MRDLRLALRMVWMVLSLLILTILAAPFIVGRDRLGALVPVCERKASYGRECPFCGMTTSFMEISRGEFGEARKANRAGIPLYSIFVSNEVGALIFVRRKGVHDAGD
jgi:Protein of unknown function (DUF2752)